jgi:hypothetical protein
MLKEIFDKIVSFLGSVVVNGIIAIFVAAAIYIFLAVLCGLAMIPVSIIAGDQAVAQISTFLGVDNWYKIIYAIVFFSMLFDDLGLPNIKTAVKRYFAQKRKNQRKESSNVNGSD